MKLKNLLLMPLLFITIGCSLGDNSLTLNKNTFDILRTSSGGTKYAQPQGINFEFGSGLVFAETDKDSYKVVNSGSVKSVTDFDISMITSFELFYRDWYEASSESKSIYGYTCGAEIVATDRLPDDATITVECVSQLNKGDTKLAECKCNITFTVSNLF